MDRNHTTLSQTLCLLDKWIFITPPQNITTPSHPSSPFLFSFLRPVSNKPNPVTPPPSLFLLAVIIICMKLEVIRYYLSMVLEPRSPSCLPPLLYCFFNTYFPDILNGVGRNRRGVGVGGGLRRREEWNRRRCNVLGEFQKQKDVPMFVSTSSCRVHKEIRQEDLLCDGPEKVSNGS